MSSPFDKDKGDQQGRISVTDAPDGTAVFEMGHSARSSALFEVGDKIRVEQNFTRLDTTRLVRCTVKLVPPTVAAVGASWLFRMLLGTTTIYERSIPTDGVERTLTDIAAGAAASASPHPVIFELELV